MTLGLQKYDALEDLKERTNRIEHDLRRAMADKRAASGFVLSYELDAVGKILKQEKDRRALGFERRSKSEIEESLANLEKEEGEGLAKWRRLAEIENRVDATQDPAEKLRLASELKLLMEGTRNPVEAKSRATSENRKIAWLKAIYSMVGTYTSADGRYHVTLETRPSYDELGEGLWLTVDGRRSRNYVGGGVGDTSEGICRHRTEIDEEGHGNWWVEMIQSEDVLEFEVQESPDSRRILVKWRRPPDAGEVGGCDGEYIRTK